MVKHFFAKLFLCEQKKRAVQHAMLVGFLELLCPVKEVHLRLKKKGPAQPSPFILLQKYKIGLMIVYQKLNGTRLQLGHTWSVYHYLLNLQNTVHFTTNSVSPFFMNPIPASSQNFFDFLVAINPMSIILTS